MTVDSAALHPCYTTDLQYHNNSAFLAIITCTQVYLETKDTLKAPHGQNIDADCNKMSENKSSYKYWEKSEDALCNDIRGD